METMTRLEKVAFMLLASSYSGVTPHIAVSFNDLRAAKVGKKWENIDVHNCERGLFEESAEVVYKTEKGAAILFRSWGTTNHPNPEDWEGEPHLMWFEFEKGDEEL